MCRGRHARRPMYLQAHVAGRVTLHVADMQPHPHAELPDLGRPTVRPHRPLSAHGRPRASRRLREGRDERVTLRAVDVTAFGDDGASHQRMMVVKDPGPRRTERARQPRRTFYVGEQQRDRPDRRLQRFLHHPIVRRVRQAQRPPRRAMLQAAPELRLGDRELAAPSAAREIVGYRSVSSRRLDVLAVTTVTGRPSCSSRDGSRGAASATRAPAASRRSPR